jgi:hypothetical protein
MGMTCPPRTGDPGTIGLSPPSAGKEGRYHGWAGVLSWIEDNVDDDYTSVSHELFHVKYCGFVGVENPAIEKVQLKGGYVRFGSFKEQGEWLGSHHVLGSRSLNVAVPGPEGDQVVNS